MEHFEIKPPSREIHSVAETSTGQRFADKPVRMSNRGAGASA